MLKKEKKTYILFKIINKFNSNKNIKSIGNLEEVISLLCFFISKRNTFEINIYVEVGIFVCWFGFLFFRSDCM